MLNTLSSTEITNPNVEVANVPTVETEMVHSLLAA
jgi:hypothetical protein